MRALVSLGLKQATAHAFVSIAEDRLHEKLAVPVLKNLPDFHLGSAWRFLRLCLTNIAKNNRICNICRRFCVTLPCVGVALANPDPRSINKCPWLFLPGTKVCGCMSEKFVFCCLFRERVIDCCRTAFCWACSTAPSVFRRVPDILANVHPKFE